jgi:hypothetical protein
MMTSRSDKAIPPEQKLLFTLDWCGPWDRLEGFILGIRSDNTLRWEVEHNSWLSRLAAWADQRDMVWKERHMALGTTPWSIWKRRHPGGGI